MCPHFESTSVYPDFFRFRAHIEEIFPQCSKLNNDYQVVIHGTCEHYLTFKSIISGTSPVPQWARIQAPSAGVLGLIPSQETRSYILQLRVSAAQWINNL